MPTYGVMCNHYTQNTDLNELIESAERVEKGIPLTQALDQALFHGSPKLFMNFSSVLL